MTYAGSGSCCSLTTLKREKPLGKIFNIIYYDSFTMFALESQLLKSSQQMMMQKLSYEKWSPSQQLNKLTISSRLIKIMWLTLIRIDINGTGRTAYSKSNGEQWALVTS